MLKVKAENIGDLYLHPTPFAKGGEGELYEVKAPKAYQQQVVKLYYPEKRTKTRAAKIEYLIAQPPAFVQADLQQLAWPVAIIEFEGQFAGFMMPKVAGQPLEILSTAKLPKKLGSDWQRFNFENKEAISLRQKICYNLAVALERIHSSRQYAVVDLKPENILIQLDGIVSIVDLDSIEVFEGEELKFAAPVATPEFSPAEFFKADEKWGSSRECWDRFSMAVIFYKLLTGIHPFAATAKAPYEQANSLAAKIENGLFVHQPTVRPILSKIPDLHQRFFQLPIELQDAFMQSFAFGAEQADMRTTASEWCWALAAEIDEFNQKAESLKPFKAEFPKFKIVEPAVSILEDRQPLFLEQLKYLKASNKLNRSWWKRPPAKKGKLSDLPAELLKPLQKIGLNVRWQMFWAIKFKNWQSFQQLKGLELSQLGKEQKEYYQEQKQLFKDQVRELNRSLAHFAQKHRLTKYKAYQQLQEDPIWRKYRGNNLEAKIWHLNNQAAEAAIKQKAKRQLAYSKLESQQHERVFKLEAEYYETLEQLAKKAKSKREFLDKNMENTYQLDQKKEKESVFIKTKKQQEQEQLKLQDQYFTQIKTLEQKQQERLFQLTEVLIAKGKNALAHFRATKRIEEDAHQKARIELEEEYILKSKWIRSKYVEVTNKQEKEITLKMKENAIKRWRLEKLNQIQQNLQQAKTDAEHQFIQNRQNIVEALGKGKEKLKLQEENTMYRLMQKMKQEQEGLQTVWQKYQEKLVEEDQLFKESQEDLSVELEEIKNRFNKRLYFSRNELMKSYQEIAIDFEKHWNELFYL